NVMAEVKASVLAIEAGRTIIFDKDDMIREADRLEMVITAING
ncbi:LpxI family protein, partial [bacterium]|nr:LpxI family protein [bacterium]